jgi:transposase
MAIPPSHVQALLPDPVSLKLRLVQQADHGAVLIVAAAKGFAASCPECKCPSRSVHSRYQRALKDLPWQGSTVQLRLEIRRFRCAAMECTRITFAEELPLVARRYGRHTTRLSETLRMIGYVLGGEAGARLSQRLEMFTSPDTILRRIKNGPSLPVQGARAVGVDDWAWRKGQSYGTILVDLEKHAPIDLIPERSADSLAAWLHLHPGAEIISRDRASLYAEGATRGAPQAIQVADRFHLLCNLTSAVERVLGQKRTLLAKAITPVNVEPVLPSENIPAATITRAEQIVEERRSRRVARYEEVVALHRSGMSQQGISRTLHIGRKTVRRFLRAGQFPERATPCRRPPRVNAFQETLNRRWAEGCHNATQLWREIQAEGYTGGRSMVACFVAAFRTHGTRYFRKAVAPRPRETKPPSPRQAAMLLSRPTDKLKPADRQLLGQLTAFPEISTLYELTQSFANVFRSKQSQALQTWLAEAKATGMPEISRFCDGLLRDAAAVTAAVILPWSNGQVEGQIHRLKLVKRQMYGRAKFELLRCRVLPYVPSMDLPLRPTLSP